jgi:hypothetical protein
MSLIHKNAILLLNKFSSISSRNDQDPAGLVYSFRIILIAGSGSTEHATHKTVGGGTDLLGL